MTLTFSIVVYEPSKPSASDNLTKLYGLQPLADTVARFHPVTGAKNKLRKSYKKHIADLPTRPEIPPPGVDLHTIGTGNVSSSATPSLLSIVFTYQGQSMHIPKLPEIDKNLLSRALVFDKSPNTGIPDFDASQLEMQQTMGNDTFSDPHQQPVKPKMSSSLLYTARLNADTLTAPESSNDDSSYAIMPKKKKKRSHNSLSPSPGFDSPGDFKRKKI